MHANDNSTNSPHQHQLAMATSNKGRSSIQQIRQPKLFQNMRTHSLGATPSSFPVDTQLPPAHARYPASYESPGPSDPAEQSWYATNEQQHAYDENTWDPDASGYHDEDILESSGHFQTGESPVSIICMFVCECLRACISRANARSSCSLFHVQPESEP